MSFTVTVHVTLSVVTVLQREMPRVYPSRDVAIKFARFESGGLYSIWGILQESVYRSKVYVVKELKERLLMSEWSLTSSHRPHINRGSD